MKPPKTTLSKFQQEIDLDEIFGVDLSEDESLKEAIGQKIIDSMLERVGDGRGIGGIKLKAPYSKVYTETLEFKAAGKSRGRVNMELTGDMLAAVDVISTDGNKIVIGIDDGDQIPKAYNHQVGDTLPKRPFFGFTKAELVKITSSFKSKIKGAARDGESAKDRLALEIIKDIKGDDDV